MLACRSHQLAIPVSAVTLGAGGKDHGVVVNRHIRAVSDVRKSDVRLSSDRICEVLRRAGYRSVADRLKPGTLRFSVILTKLVARR
jgi:hypothetical protein